MSEVMGELAKDYVEAKTTEPEDIELEGYGAKRVFKGHELYWSEDGSSETGVFLTARGKIAYWSFCPGGEPAETFKVYEDLDELWQEQEGLEEQYKGSIKTQIQTGYQSLTNKPMVERLDI
jgi:hypothetical protein